MNSANLFSAKCVIVGDGAVGKVNQAKDNECASSLRLLIYLPFSRLVYFIPTLKENFRKVTCQQ